MEKNNEVTHVIDTDETPLTDTLIDRVNAGEEGNTPDVVIADEPHEYIARKYETDEDAPEQVAFTDMIAPSFLSLAKEGLAGINNDLKLNLSLDDLNNGQKLAVVWPYIQRAKKERIRKAAKANRVAKRRTKNTLAKKSRKNNR